jgi:hypothetical protein
MRRLDPAPDRRASWIRLHGKRESTSAPPARASEGQPNPYGSRG